MKIKRLDVYLYRVADGYAAHVRQGLRYGTDLFEDCGERPRNWREAEQMSRFALVTMGLEVETVAFFGERQDDFPPKKEVKKRMRKTA